MILAGVKVCPFGSIAEAAAIALLGGGVITIYGA